MTEVATALERENPTWNRGSGIGVRPLQDHLVGASVRSWMLMLLAAVASVLPARHSKPAAETARAVAGHPDPRGGTIPRHFLVS
jgi:hypothetical protein